jgi:putative transposase
MGLWTSRRYARRTMSRFRRAATGSTFFFTVVSHRRQPILCTEPIRSTLRHATERVRDLHPFAIDAWVLLPDHLHCIWTLPDGDHDFSTRWSQIKHHVSFVCGQACAGGAVSASRRKHRDANVWQRRFWEHQIRDDIDLERHMNYIHFNPVKHGLVASAAEWPYSTFHRYVKAGVYPLDWGGVSYLADLDFE